ncbi:MAG TPA: hypothetical protein DEV64_03120 [Rhodospirillaceae bacterium]|nr:hypothetical protein [Rhodospirillaceae bacterium]
MGIVVDRIVQVRRTDREALVFFGQPDQCQVGIFENRSEQADIGSNVGQGSNMPHPDFLQGRYNGGAPGFRRVR